MSISSVFKTIKGQEFLQFLLAGGIAALCNFTSRIIFDYWLSFNLSIFLAYLIGMVTAFLLFRQQVFKPSDQHGLKAEIIRFALVNAVAFVQTLLFSNLFAHWIFPAIGWVLYPYAIAHLIGIGTPVITSYFGHKHHTFKKSPPRHSNGA